MKNIAKPLKQQQRMKIFLGLDWKDVLFSIILICLSSAIWLPLITNHEFIIGIVVLILSIIITGSFMIKIFDMRIYLYIYKTIRFIFTQVKKQQIDFVEEIQIDPDNINHKIILKDVNKSIYCFYRIIGKDVTLLDDYDFTEIATKLGIFFKENDNINLLKIDGKINFNKITEYINSLHTDNVNLQKEIKNNLITLEKLKANFYSSTQSKYFLAFKLPTKTADIMEQVNIIKEKLNYAQLDLKPADIDELYDISDKLYFNNIIINEYRKYLHVTYDKKNHDLTLEEIDLYNNLKINEPFYFRNECYVLINLNQWMIFNNVNSSETNPVWTNCDNPFQIKESKEKLITFISIKAFPQTVDRNWLEPLFNIQGMDINFKVTTVDIKNIERIITTALTNCEEKLEASQNSNAIKYKKLQDDYLSYDELAVAVANGDEIKQISCILKIEAQNEKELNKAIKGVCKQLIRMKFEFSRLIFEQVDAMKDFFANDSLGLKNQPIEVLDSVLGYGFPFTQQELIDNQGLYLGNDSNATPVFIDFKKIDTFKNSSSTIILGKTGSGKTTTTKRILKNQMISGAYKIYVIDPENEYGDLFLANGGNTIDVSNSKTIINPFDLNLKYDIDDENKNNAINDKIQFLETFFRIIFDKKISEENIAWLIQQTSELLWNSSYEITFSDLYKYIQKHQNRAFVVEQVGYFCHCANGNKAYLWDSKTNININSDYICFGFRELLSKSGTTSIGIAQIFLVMQYLNSLVLKNRVENAKYINIVIDEAHLLIDPKYLQVVQFATEMFKRIRKYNGMMTLITQNVSDFYKQEIRDYSTSMIKNAFFLLIHTIQSQEIPELDLLMREQGGLKEIEKSFLTSGTYGKCLFIFNKVRTLIDVSI